MSMDKQLFFPFFSHFSSFFIVAVTINRAGFSRYIKNPEPFGITANDIRGF